MFTKLIFNLKLLTNISFKSEKFYIINYIFKEFFSIDIEIIFLENKSSIFEIQKEGKSLIISDVFFNQDIDKWLTSSWLPKLPLSEFKTADYKMEDCSPFDKIPILFSSNQNKKVLSKIDNGYFLDLDIFGSAFFFITRFEEYVSNESDQHGRFPYKSSIIYKESLINRPIVNEYLEIIWNCITRIWPNLNRKKGNSELI